MINRPTPHLSSSNFLIGKEKKWISTNQAYKSTFKNDYPPKYCIKTSLSDRPLPSQIMHSDDRINDKFSVTHHSFVNQQQTEKSKACNTLTKTNFKMERDNRIETFQTTHNLYYKNNNNMVIERRKDFSQRMESHIPQGDEIKEFWPKSDYKSNFQGDQLSSNMKVNSSDFTNAQQVIQGDERSHIGKEMFHTTSRKMFPLYQVDSQYQVPYNVKYPATEIPCGGEKQFESTHQASFPCLPPLKSYVSFQRKKAIEELQQTAFCIGDKRLSRYDTTARDSFKKPELSIVHHVKNNGTRVSSENVCYKEPAFNQIGCTVNTTDFQKKSYENKIVDGSKLHTVSKVTFGDNRQLFYDTTMDSCFPRQVVNRKVTPDVNTYSSSVPLNRADRSVNQSSYRTDFIKSNSKRLLPNPVAIDNLVKSHIRSPLASYREFHTTNRDTYTPKPRNSIAYIDTGRLQKSSVPLGTLVY